MRRLVLLLFFLTLGPVAGADMVDSSPHGFTTKTVSEISALPRAVYLALTAQVGHWWDPQHTWSGDARNMAIDPRAGGCFGEKLSNSGSVQHKIVILAAGGRSRVELAYVAGGYVRGGLEPLAKIVDGVLGTQVQRLKQYVETGRPS